VIRDCSFCAAPFSFSSLILLVGSLTCKNRLPYNLYCVGGDVKHCTIQSNPFVLEESDEDIRGYSNVTKEFYRDIVTTYVLKGVHIHPEILAGIGVEYGKSGFPQTKALIYLFRGTNVTIKDK